MSHSVGGAVMQSRAYQIEMFEESLKGNRIICMSTGSGKTQVAKLRIEAELKKSPNKIVWFLTPNVALSQQQHTYLRTQLPAYRFRIITSLDGVEHWSTQRIWDAALCSIEVVVSTPQPLLDALGHGFVRMNRLSLLVFDEAHHCMKKAPMNRIMQIFYHPTKHGELACDLPHILGLSASPITSSKTSLEDVERNLNAICKTPTLQIDEYKQFVHEPEFRVLEYTVPGPSPEPLILIQIRRTINGLDINDDPHVRFLRQNGGPKSGEKLSELLETRATPTFKQLRALERRATDLHHELGESACNTFVAECCVRLHSQNFNANRLVPTLTGKEWKYLDNVLSQTRCDADSLRGRKSVSDQLSTKAATLVKFLAREYTSDIRCVIFVKQRSAAWALSELLNLHPECQGKYSAEPFVGLSKVDRNIQLVDLVKMRNPSQVLANFRSGQANIVVSTSVMEEGVDIPATNLVVRFDDSENFRSFIQSRGRARHPHSKFVTLLQRGSDGNSYQPWKKLEAEMKKKYADESREIAEMEEEEEELSRAFCVESTEATLTLDSASQHLDHFCSKLPKVAYVDEPRPEYILERVTGIGVSAKVILPNSVARDVRQFSGSLCKTERMAKRDAAFEAYLGLYRAGLVNDNLLPAVVPEADDIVSMQIESRESMCRTSSRFDPWREIATSCNLEEAELFTLRLDIFGKERRISPVLLILPRSLKTFLEIPLLWTPSSTFTARVTPYHVDLPASFEITIARKVTQHLFKTIYSHKMLDQGPALSGYPCMIVPADYMTSLKEWLEDPLGMMPEDDKVSLESHVVRLQDRIRPYFFRDATRLNGVYSQTQAAIQDRLRNGSTGASSESDDSESGSQDSNMVEVMRLPRRINFLQPVASDMAHTAWESVPWSECSIVDLPASYARTMLFIPSILHIIGIGLVAQNAVDTLLSPIGFKDPKYVMTALTASAADEYINYQSLEFLGDSLLKYYTSFQLFAQFPKWHEEYLTRKRSSIVGNARLYRAALDVDLGRFIHTEAFAGAQWKVRTNADLRSKPKDQRGRHLSTKVLADVVEALIGAAYVDGTDPQESERQSLACMRLFLPEVPWDTVQANISRCQYAQLPEDVSVSHFETVEAMIGYRFENRVLIAEALTHPSAIDTFGSYQRLEYLGDAVLDHIVVTTVFRAADQRLKHYDMHLIRTALVTADLLAFFCLETSMDLQRIDVSTDNRSHQSTIISGTERKYLCQFMTATGNAIMQARQSCIDRHLQLRERVNQAIHYGDRYPWLLLIRLHADKFLSDIIESILGAIYIDSRGSIEACKGFLEKIGFLSYLQRIIREPTIEVMHPKERLGTLRSGKGKIGYETSWSRREDDQVAYRTKVLIDGKVFAASDDGLSQLEAETEAAELAIAKLAATGEDFGSTIAPCIGMNSLVVRDLDV